MQNIKNNKKVIIIVVILLVVVCILAYLNYKPKEDSSSTTQGENDPKSKVSLVTEESTIWGLRNVINKYYENLSFKNTDDLYKVLNPTYIKENNITKSNILTKLHAEAYEMPAYIIQKAYVATSGSTTYYFINGYLINKHFDTDNREYESNINSLLIVKNDNYIYNPIEVEDDPETLNIIEDDIEYIADNYDIKNINFNSTYRFTRSTQTTQSKLEYYIKTFMELMYIDASRAYNMLNSRTKENYPTLESFENDIDKIYENYFISYMYYDENNDNGYNYYYMQNYNMDTIAISEYNTMNYKIDFEFSNITNEKEINENRNSIIDSENTIDNSEIND